MGTETEYGIYVRGGFDGPYEKAIDFANEAIRSALRDSPVCMGRQLEVSYGNRNNLYQHIANGARFYIDCGHPEMSIPECPTPRDVVIWDGAGERIVQAAARDASRDTGMKISIVKKLTDGRGHTWGCHENYCIEPELFEGLMAEGVRPIEQRIVGTWFAIRQLLIGGGKIGSDDVDRENAFQLSQRADFILDFRNSSTTSNRPIIQTRDEPLAEKALWRRLHVICGDANLCQWSTYLKMGLTGLLLLMLQDDTARRRSPLPLIDGETHQTIMRHISHDNDLEMSFPVRISSGIGRLSDKYWMSAAKIIGFYLRALRAYVKKRAWASPQEAAVYEAIVTKAQWMTSLLEKRNWRALYGWLDWPTKRVVAEEYLHRKNKTWKDALNDDTLLDRLRLLADHSYAALDPDVSIYARLARAGIIRTVVKESEIARALMTPPAGRASQRSALIEAYLPYLVSAHWDRMQFQQSPFAVAVFLDDPMGSPDEALSAALKVCATPLDLFIEHSEGNCIPHLRIVKEMLK